MIRGRLRWQLAAVATLAFEGGGVSAQGPERVGIHVLERRLPEAVALSPSVVPGAPRRAQLGRRV